MKKLLTLICLLAMTALPAMAKTKQDLTTRVDEAAQVCREYVTSTSKEPSTLAFSDYQYHLEIRNDLELNMNVTGENIDHKIKCWANCSPDHTCSVREMTDNGHFIVHLGVRY